MWRFAALWVCRIGPATQTHTHRTGVGGQNLPSSHTHTHSSTPHPLQLLSILHPLSSPRLLPMAAPCSPSLLNKERFRGEGVKGARGNSYVCMWKWAMADTWTVQYHCMCTKDDDVCCKTCYMCVIYAVETGVICVWEGGQLYLVIQICPYNLNKWVRFNC